MIAPASAHHPDPTHHEVEQGRSSNEGMTFEPCSPEHPVAPVVSPGPSPAPSVSGLAAVAEVDVTRPADAASQFQPRRNQLRAMLQVFRL